MRRARLSHHVVGVEGADIDLLGWALVMGRPVLPCLQDGDHRPFFDIEVLEKVVGEPAEGVGESCPGCGCCGVVELLRGCFDLVEDVGHDAVIGLPVECRAELWRTATHSWEQSGVLGAVVRVDELAVAQAVRPELEQRTSAGELVQGLAQVRRRRVGRRDGSEFAAGPQVTSQHVVHPSKFLHEGMGRVPRRGHRRYTAFLDRRAPGVGAGRVAVLGWGRVLAKAAISSLPWVSDWGR